MKNAMTKQALLNSVMGLAAASILAVSPAVFAGSDATTHEGTTTKQYESTSTTSQESGMTQEQQSLSDTQDKGVDDKELTGTQDADMDAGSEQGITDAQPDPQFEEQDEQGLTDTGTGIGTGTGADDQMLNSLSTDELENREIVNLKGEEIGSVQEVVTEADGSISGVVVSVGGVLGMGAEELFAGVDEIQMKDDQLVWQTALSPDALSETQQYKAAGATEN